MFRSLKKLVVGTVCFGFALLVSGCGISQSSLLEEHSPIYVNEVSLEEMYVSVPSEYKLVKACISEDKDCNSNSFKELSSVEEKSDRNIFKLENSNKFRFIEIVAQTEQDSVENTVAEFDGEKTENKIERKIQIVDKDSKNDSSQSTDPKIVQYNGYQCYGTTEEVCKAEYIIFKNTNELRKSMGRSELQPNIALSYLARLWSTEQARQGGISHSWFQSGVSSQKFNQLRSQSFQDAANVRWLSAENVAANWQSSSGQAAGTELYNQWRTSPGHYANMVGGHKYLGVGVVIGVRSSYPVYGTQIFGQ